MGKIHTHYDNLKVSRMAPQEVIRAAYKALSQKYHPDKNPGNEKAARIMAILNGAYGTLADPQRRKEHDEWIAAEEWEIEWLESTRQEESRGKHLHDLADQAYAQDFAPPAPARFQGWRDWKWWCGLAACLSLGWIGGVLMHSQPDVMPGALASGLGSPPDSGSRTDSKPELKAAPMDDPKAEAIFGPKPDIQPYIKVMAVSQVILPSAPDACASESQTLLAPDGKPWPLQSGYVEGFPIGSMGDDLQLTLDNAANASPVFIKLYETDRRFIVRHIFILPHDKLTVGLTMGKYEVRYQKVRLGSAGKHGCARKTA